MNIVSHLVHNKKIRPKKTALKYFKNRNLYTLNWIETYQKIEQVFKALDTYSVNTGQQVCIYSNTNKEWGFLDMAIMAHRGVTVPLYHSSHIDEIEAILTDTEINIIFIENLDLFEKIKHSAIFQKIEHKILIEDNATSDDLISFSDFLKNASSEKNLKEAANKVQPDDLATIIFTSGTSGRPKGVMLNHEQIISSNSDVFPLLGVTDNDCTLTFLPFSHVLGRMELWGHYFCGYTIGYAESIERIKKNLLDVKPTVLVGVPRIFEKIYFGIQAQVEISKLKQFVFSKAIAVGKNRHKLQLNKKAPSFLQAFSAQMAHHLVFANIQQKLGGNLRFAVSGGAPLDTGIAQFFSACGLSILEGYGLTETTAPIFINTLFAHKMGSVGKAIGDVQVQLAEDGEILVRSKKVMQGYYKNPQATDEVFTSHGYFRTGDIGQIDKEGFLKITDRKKDLIKTAGGKFVAPQKLQMLFATHPLISHIHVHGDKKKYIVALLTIEKEEALKIAKENNISESWPKLIEHSLIQQEVRSTVAHVNSQLGSFETIKRFHILDHDFSIEGGQLTPSLKMKRKKIDELYKPEIEKLYL